MSSNKYDNGRDRIRRYILYRSDSGSAQYDNTDDDNNDADAAMMKTKAPISEANEDIAELQASTEDNTDTRAVSTED